MTLVPNCMLHLLDWLLTALSLPAMGGAAYLAWLTLWSRSRPPAPAAAQATRFDVIVPAHDEEPVIAETVASLLAMEYPRDRFRVWVVADNCTDATAIVARQAGAEVIERRDEERRGKGYALAHAFQQTNDGHSDAVVVVDADTLVSPNLLTAFDARLATGAGCLQADYAVRNPTASWRTRLMTVAFALHHGVRSLARERLGLSCGLRGNGMAMARATLARVPHDAFSIVEDIEYGIRLGLANIRVGYVHEAHVWGEMVTGEGASRSQRRRWEVGRRALRRRHTLPLLRSAWRSRSPVLLDLALDLIVPPLTTLVVMLGVLWVAGAGLALTRQDLTVTWAATTLGLACVLLYVARGWRLSGVSLATLLISAPAYVLWKVRLAFTRERTNGEWVRTTREDRS